MLKSVNLYICHGWGGGEDNLYVSHGGCVMDGRQFGPPNPFPTLLGIFAVEAWETAFIFIYNLGSGLHALKKMTCIPTF